MPIILALNHQALNRTDKYLLADTQSLVHLPKLLTHLDSAPATCGLDTSYAAC